MKKKHSSSGGFSMIEMAIALAVATICLVTLMGLIPTGLNTNKNALNKTTASSVLASVLSDLRSTTKTTPPAQATPTPSYYLSPTYQFQIPLAGGAGSIAAPQQAYIDGTGAILAANGTTPSTQNLTDARFCISVGFTPPGTGKAATVARIMITWPPQTPGNTTGNWPINYTGSLETTVYLDLN